MKQFDNTPLTGANNLQAGQIEIKIYPDKDYKVKFYATAKKITIDWGDGVVENFTPNGIRESFPHQYPPIPIFETIKVNAEGLTYFGSSSFVSDESKSKVFFHEIKFGSCPDLKEISCTLQNELTVLDVDNCAALAELDCSLNKKLNSLNLSKCITLINLNCSGNQLPLLDVSSCVNLIYLNCGFNELTELDVSKCSSLIELDCSHNQLSVSVLNALFNSLPTRKPDDNAQINCAGNLGDDAISYFAGYATYNKSIAIKKGWTVK